jgi:protein SMG5
MRDMAQLRLRAEVTQLEGTLQQASGGSACSGADDKGKPAGGPANSADLPPYLVPDAPTLCDHLNLVKQLAASSRFIIIIPLPGEDIASLVMESI